MERPRGIGAVLRLGAEVLAVCEGRAIVPRSGAEVLIMIEERAAVLRRL